MTTSAIPETDTPKVGPATDMSNPEFALSLPQHGVDTSAVPFRVHDGIHIPVERYFDPQFAELENTKMWLHTWQWAAREEDIPLPGDYIEYKIVDRTVVIVRQPDNSIKAMHNVCPHRATQLVETGSCGTFGGNQIVCPFHGWRWNTDGAQSYIYGRQGFDAESIDPSKVGLREVRSAVKYGFIWINLDDDAPSIEEFFGTYDNHLAPTCMDRMRVRWWKYAVVPANWKVGIEAFMEAYHIMQAHPELALGATGDAYKVDGLHFYHHGMGHVDTTPPFDPADPTSFSVTESPIEDMSFGRYFLEQNRVLYEGTDGSSTARDEYIADRVRGLPEEEVFLKFFEELYKYAADANIPLPPLDPNMANYGFIFPNMVVLGIPGNMLFYRVRPNGHDPNSSIFEALGMQIPRQDDMGMAAPRPQGPLEVHEWPFILRQDVENISRQQIGYRSGALSQATMSPRYEPMICTLHSEIDRYIATH
jgi:phenylpropionate dioxygenase-like ring-hydroxylating dioxygenase large terminal subunit